MTNHNSIIQYNTGWLRMCAKICCGCHFLFIFLVLFSFFLFVNFVLVHIFYLRELLYSKNSDFLHICASYVLSVFYKIFFVSPFKSFFNPFLSLLSLYIVNRLQPSYVYGSPYLGATNGASQAGLVPIQATQLSHAAAIAAATNQFYEYQVFCRYILVNSVICVYGKGRDLA